MHRFIVLAAAVPLAFPPAAAAQRAYRQVAGRVIDAVSGLPLRAGVVSVASTRLSDRLRPDGVFVLRVPAGPARLTVRSPGYEPREIVVPDVRDAIIVGLEPLASDLDAVVVTAAVGASGFPGDGPVSVDEMLGARVAGFESMRNSGAAGDVQVRLRGVSTIVGNGSPLWVLDGVLIQDVGATSGVGGLVGGSNVVPSRIADLNPRDIASVELLRGASATAMYGSRGANGVVIVRTRR